MKYSISITEYFNKVVEIEANSMKEAVNKAKSLYNEGKIVFCPLDYLGSEIVTADEKTIL